MSRPAAGTGYLGQLAEFRIRRLRAVASGAFEHRKPRRTGDLTALRTGARSATEGEEATAKARNVSHHWHLLPLRALRPGRPVRAAEPARSSSLSGGYSPS